MYFDEDIEHHLASIYVGLEVIADDLWRARDNPGLAREIGSRIQAIKLQIVAVEEDIGAIVLVQRAFHEGGWWYRFWHSHIPRLPTGKWSRQLSVKKERLAELETKLKDMRIE
jgi:hypothetical protein